MATLIRYTPNALTRAQYDEVNEILRSKGEGDPPPALRIHVLFGDEGNLRISEIWDDEDAWREWFDGDLKDALTQAGIEQTSPEILQVHEIWGTGIANP